MTVNNEMDIIQEAREYLDFMTGRNYGHLEFCEIISRLVDRLEWKDAKKELPEVDGDYLVKYFPFEAQETSDKLGLDLRMKQEIFICYFRDAAFRSPLTLKRPELRNVPLNNVTRWLPLPPVGDK